ncbi:MAG TPA: tetratricopeptide repeat protein [Steroidobacteraceae bacterium]|nr:tetratricopeptide repeat protein [Steroidobacteraceae bacterium]
MQRDYLSNPVSAQSDATLRVIDDFIEGYLAYETRAERILAAADADPESCLANAYAALLWMLLEAPEGAQRAAKYLAAAERAAAHATRREQLNTAMLKAWTADDAARTLRLCDRISDEFPRDLVVVKTHQYLEFNRGNSPEMLRVALKVANANADVPYLHGMAAFAYEQCHLLSCAEAEARAALEIRRKEPWAQHALAHVLLTRGQIDEGARFLEQAADTWTELNSFMFTHIWWHLALFYLSQGRDQKVLELYDRHCWGIAKEYSQDQIGAISLLARLELAGVDVGPRWQDLGRHLVARARDTVLPFLTLQYLYGLARAGCPEADTLLESVRNAADCAPSFTREVWRDVALPGCEGLYAYARGDYAAAWRHLVSCVPRIAEAGGSHAQRDLFELILLDTAVKLGRSTTAQQMLERRRMADPNGVPVNAALAAVYANLGLPQLAKQASARAELTRSRHCG